jgi:hypothetical protein
MDPILKNEIVNLLKSELKVQVEVKKNFSTIHTVITTVKLGDEIISKESKDCDIGSIN